MEVIVQRTAEQVRNLQDFINELWAIPASEFAMRNYECGTAACMQGWYERLYGIRGVRPSDRFGIDEWHNMCHMVGHRGSSLTEFDRMLSPEERKLAMLHILTQALNTGQGCWIVALVETVGPEVAKEILDPEIKEMSTLQRHIPAGETTTASMQRALPDRAEPHKEAALLLEEAW